MLIPYASILSVRLGFRASCQASGFKNLGGGHLLTRVLLDVALIEVLAAAFALLLATFRPDCPFGPAKFCSGHGPIDGPGVSKL